MNERDFEEETMIPKRSIHFEDIIQSQKNKCNRAGTNLNPALFNNNVSALLDLIPNSQRKVELSYTRNPNTITMIIKFYF